MNKNCVKCLTAAIIAATVCAVISCASTPKEISSDMTAREIVQQAQTAYDNGNTALAEKYYTILLQRYGTDTAVYVEGRYEIAHLYVKGKKYREAVPILKEIISIYATATPGTLPGAYNKLAKNELSRIPKAYVNETPSEATGVSD